MIGKKLKKPTKAFELRDIKNSFLKVNLFLNDAG
jgi:hypothetical protein